MPYGVFDLELWNCRKYFSNISMRVQDVGCRMSDKLHEGWLVAAA